MNDIDVINNPANILKIDNPSDELILLALRRDGTLIRHFKNQTPSMQMAAFINNPDSARYVDEPSESLIKAMLNMPGDPNDPVINDRMAKFN